MKVPIEWVKELVKFKVSEEQLAKMLTMSGLETIVLQDHILEIDVLPNRSDALSIRGIAREVSALLRSYVRCPKSKVREISKNIKTVAKVEVRDKELCPRYMARVIEGVKIGESPEWLKKRLERAGLRPINNVVDVTNYLLLELGQPMHAFDINLIKDRHIVVRRANPAEKAAALDGKEYELEHDVLVISDPEKVIAIGGLIGCSNTEVNQNTKAILLESAYFNPVSIHKTSKFLKVRTESSLRFEHGVDWKAVEETLDRGAAMIAELSGGKVLRGKIDVKTTDHRPQTLDLRPERVNQILGTDISVREMVNILERLGFKVVGRRSQVAGRIKVEIPLFRAADIYREIDLIEEIARIYGYEKIKATLPQTAFFGKQEDKEDIFRQKIKEIMVGCGLNEVQTYSMLGPKDFEKTGLPTQELVQISNPLTVEESLLRTSLLPSLLNCVVYNLNRQIENVFIFEIGKVFLPSGESLPEERWMLTAVATGSPFMSALDKGEVDYFYLKGILENLFAQLGIKLPKFITSDNSLLQPGKGSEIEELGIVGQLHPRLQRNYELPKPVCFFEIDLDNLFKPYSPEKKYIPLPKFPSVIRDIAMFVPAGATNDEISFLIKEIGENLVEKVSLFDKYKDSLAYRITYRHPERTLTDEEVNKKHKEIGEVLVSRLNVRIR